MTGATKPELIADAQLPERFRVLFDRHPDEEELRRFATARELLVMRLPARAPRRTARLICRL
jgi:hypothetical protein